MRVARRKKTNSYQRTRVTCSRTELSVQKLVRSARMLYVLHDSIFPGPSRLLEDELGEIGIIVSYSLSIHSTKFSREYSAGAV